MDALKQQLLRIQQQLTALSASQKMLTASLVVIMIMTMFYWSRYAGSSEMAVLLDQALAPEEIAQMKNALAAKGVNYEVQGDRLLVPADKRSELVAELGYMQLLPHDLKDSFTEIFLGNDNPFAPQSQKDQLLNHSKEVALSRVISRWPGVKNATVIIDGTRKWSPGRSVEPTAAVAIWMASGEGMNRRIVEAAADLVSGAQAGMARTSVKISVNGQPVAVHDPNDPSGFGGGENPILEAKAKYEQYYADKISSQLSYIQGLHAVVSVDLRTQSSRQESRKVGPKDKVEALKRSVTTSMENTAENPAGEPGMVSNGSLSIEGSSSGNNGQHSTSEKTEIENVVDTGYVQTTTSDPAGSAVPVTAGVRVPSSYFASIWKMENPAATSEPLPADIDKIVERETPHIRDAVRAATNITDDNAISVARYIDITQPLSGGEAAAGLASLPTGFGFGAKEIAIGVLAIISLFMVSMMVRKSVPQPVIAAPAPLADEPMLQQPTMVGDAEMAAEVSEGGLLLTGHEMSEESIQAQQVIEQVGSMVDENPDVAANLVKRWLNRD